METEVQNKASRNTKMSLTFERPPEQKHPDGQRGDGIARNLIDTIAIELTDTIMFLYDERPDAGMSVISYMKERQRKYEQRELWGDAEGVAQEIAWISEVREHLVHTKSLFTILQEKKVR